MNRTFNKRRMVEEVAERTGMDLNQAQIGVEAILAAVIEAVGQGESVHIAGFGRFETYKRQARAGSHPRTHEPMAIPAVQLPVFRPSERLRERFK